MTTPGEVDVMFGSQTREGCCGKPWGCTMPLAGCQWPGKRQRIAEGREKPQDIPAMFAEQGRCYYCGSRFDDAPSATCQRLDLHERVA